MKEKKTPYLVGDIGDKETLEAFAKKVIEAHGRVNSISPGWIDSAA